MRQNVLVVRPKLSNSFGNTEYAEKFNVNEVGDGAGGKVTIYSSRKNSVNENRQS